MANPNLNCLPIEIIDSICRCLQRICCNGYNNSHAGRLAGTKGLAVLCRTSKRLNVVATPYLYRHVNINNLEVDLVRFASSLLHKQHLADLVHEVDIEQEKYVTLDEPLQNYILAHPVSFIHNRRVGGPPWDIRSEEWWGVKILEVLFVRLRKLSSITLLARDAHFANEVLSPIVDKHQHDFEFPGIFKEIIIRGVLAKGDASITAYTTVFPLISSTCIQNLMIQDCVHIPVTQHCSVPSLLELRIMNSSLESKDFSKIVKWCPNLQLLSYEIGDALILSNNADFPTTRSIIKAITPLSKTLQTFVLNQRSEYNPNVEQLDTIAHFGKLQNLIIGFHDLTHEALMEDGEEPEADDEPQMLFVEHFLSKFPKSLRNLCIIDARESLEPDFINLSETDEGILPNLKSVIVDAPLGLQSEFVGTGIDYMEVDRQTLMGVGISMEDYVTGCWLQMEQNRKNQG